MSDKLFHKKRERNKKDLERKKAKRLSFEKVLIVCEGVKTEPNYFNEIKDYYQLNTAHVVVDGNCGSDPWSVYLHAKMLSRNAKADKDPYDKVFCVFDKDKHTSYQRAITTIVKENNFTAINSVPCFEYWLLLHFVYTSKPFIASGNKSICDKTNEELKIKGRLPDYQKGALGIFEKLISGLETAKINAQRALKDSESNQTDNPSTRVHILVNYLQSLKGKS